MKYLAPRPTTRTATSPPTSRRRSLPLLPLPFAIGGLAFAIVRAPAGASDRGAPRCTRGGDGLAGSR